MRLSYVARLVQVVCVIVLVWLDGRVPTDYRAIAARCAVEEGVPLSLVLAVIEAESGGNPRAVSRSGAVGLMQLMPSTARFVAERKGWPVPEERDLFQPECNIRIGVAYLGMLLRRYRGDKVLALAAYHAGPTQVDRWKKMNPGRTSAGLWQRVFFKSTRRYVLKVLRLESVYREGMGSGK